MNEEDVWVVYNKAWLKIVHVYPSQDLALIKLAKYWDDPAVYGTKTNKERFEVVTLKDAIEHMKRELAYQYDSWGT
jgi:hypothetical protein